MSKPVETAQEDQPSREVQKEVETVARKETNRDLVEQIVVALILAFLIRGYVAEAFVIPTGFDGAYVDGPAQGSDVPAVRDGVFDQRIGRGGGIRPA